MIFKVNFNALAVILTSAQHQIRFGGNMEYQGLRAGVV